MSDPRRRLAKVLVANRGEIAVRVIRAARDAGLRSVAVYADPDADALFVRLADEAYPLGGSTAHDSYLSADRILSVARDCGADSVHPGYGFLAESADFARAVIAAGLIWIGPPPGAIEQLGDKVSARRVARSAGAPLAPGTGNPVTGIDEVATFVAEVGFPIAIKAAHGGGGRGLKVVRHAHDLESAYESAVREATAAFGRGECFVEKYLDAPRHVETQCLADQHGAVVVVSTRDCTLQRRHQKLVEEAPAPFLSQEQLVALYDSSKRILRAVGYVGAGTCEFLVAPDGAISFLEVNTRLQVEHCVSEEVTGIDLVREMFRIAEGEPLGYDDPEVTGHAIEFRINAEDPANGFLPSPGRLARWRTPAGPGVRVDEGYAEGDVVPASFDSLIAKLVVTGRDRRQALERSRRALREIEVSGMPTVVPFHRAVVEHPSFVGPTDGAQQEFGVHTTWIESDLDLDLDPFQESGDDRAKPEAGDARLPHAPPSLRVTRGMRPHRRQRGSDAAEVYGQAVVAPMPGTVLKVLVDDGQRVETGHVIAVLEAMKMELPVPAHRSGVVSRLRVRAGIPVDRGEVLCDVIDA